MDSKQFQSQFERLIARSSWRNKFDQSFSDILWEQIKVYSVAPFEKAVDELLGQHTCPTVSDILALTRKHNYGTRSEMQIENNGCSWCDGFGVVTMQKLDRVAPFACQKCGNGKKVLDLTSKLSDGSIATVGQGLHIGFEPTDPHLREKIMQSFKLKKAERAKHARIADEQDYWYNG